MLRILANRKTIWLLLALVVLGSGIMWSSMDTSVWAENEEEHWFNDFGTLMEVVSLVKTRYYQPVSIVNMVAAYVQTGTINGMLHESLDDPYTRYMSPHAYEQMMSRTTGYFGGIGIVIGMREEQLTVISPIRGTPGERAGLRGEDQILYVDGIDTSFMSLEEAVSLMRGPEGTPVTLTIGRGDEVLDVPIIRDIINVESVGEVKMLNDHMGYIELTNFSERTYVEFVAALDELESQGMLGLILDLRFNPGGTLSTSLMVADEFISAGPLLFVEDRNGNRLAYEADPVGTRASMPIVILTNGATASGSEIVAGALRDNGLATIVGEQTFGKGLVQSVHTLRDGSAVTITEQFYLTAGGHDINKRGIIPDVVIELSEEEEEELFFGSLENDIQLEEAVNQLRQKLQTVAETVHPN